MSSRANTIINSAHIEVPSFKVISWLQHPPNLLDRNPLGVSYTRTSTDPLIYSVIFGIPVLFGLFKLPVTTEATFSNKEDGVFVTTNTYGIKTSSEWKVVGNHMTGSECDIYEDFKLVKWWWGFSWFIMSTTKKEHISLMKNVRGKLKEEFNLGHDLG